MLNEGTTLHLDESKRVHSLCGMLIRFRDAEATWLPFSCILDAK